jgi:hypothetical protein
VRRRLRRPKELNGAEFPQRIELGLFANRAGSLPMRDGRAVMPSRFPTGPSSPAFFEHRPDTELTTALSGVGFAARRLLASADGMRAGVPIKRLGSIRQAVSASSQGVVVGEADS